VDMYLDGSIPQTYSNLVNLTTFILQSMGDLSPVLPDEFKFMKQMTDLFLNFPTDKLFPTFCWPWDYHIDVCDVRGVYVDCRCPKSGPCNGIECRPCNYPLPKDENLLLAELFKYLPKHEYWYDCSDDDQVSHVTKLVINNPAFRVIPNNMNKFPQLTYLEFSDIILEAQIPPALGSLKNLHTLIFRNVTVPGTIPDTLGNLRSLETLYLFFSSFRITLQNIPKCFRLGYHPSDNL